MVMEMMDVVEAVVPVRVRLDAICLSASVRGLLANGTYQQCCVL